VVCSPSGGAIETNLQGELVCGPGFCTKDLRGDFHCSSAARGAASTDRYGEPVCAVSCVRAQAQACVRPVPAN
jgi:hypothetical protein